MTSMEILAVHDLLDKAGVGMGPLDERVRQLIAENDRLNAAMAAEAKKADRERLLEALDEGRHLTLMALADACLDEGRPEEAKGWGWLAAHRKWPAQCPHGWVWSHLDNSLSVPNQSHQLPAALCRALLEVAWASREEAIKSARASLESVVTAIATGAWRP